MKFVPLPALHIEAGLSVLLNTGIGLTVTTTLSPALLQPFAVVMITYVTAIGLAVVLVKVSLIPPNGTAVVETAAWLMPGINALLYVKPAPVVALDGL